MNIIMDTVKTIGARTIAEINTMINTSINKRHPACNVVGERNYRAKL